MIILVRLVFAVCGAALLWITLSLMARLSWELNGLIAFGAIVAFAFFFERDDAADAPR